MAFRIKKIEKHDDEDVEFDCPHCHTKGVVGHSYNMEYANQIGLFFAWFTLGTHEESFVTCPSCQTKFSVAVPIRDLLDNYYIDDRHKLFKPQDNIGTVGISFLTAFVPFFGILISLWAIYANRKRPDLQTYGYITLVLCIAISIITMTGHYFELVFFWLK